MNQTSFSPNYLKGCQSHIIGDVQVILHDQTLPNIKQRNKDKI